MKTTAVKERPILFSGPMVRAIFDRVKMQTRRIMDPQPPREAAVVDPYNGDFERFMAWSADHKMFLEPGNVKGTAHWRCRQGVPGDRLWVRESFSYHLHDEGFWYWADGHAADKDSTRPKPSIHMPRLAARLMLLMTGLRAQKLHEISEADARAEGIREVTKDGVVKKYCVYDKGDMSSVPWAEMPRTAVDAYRALWETINGEGSWAANPWVWVIEFKRVTD
jgi:hypothetical protein